MVEKSDVIDVLRGINDPEIPLNVVDLGLIYDVIIADSVVTVNMTLTALGCPAAVYFPTEVQSRIMTLPGVEEARVNIVYEPPWSISRVSEEGKLFLETLGLKVR
ncbi:MAG: metal-sulfur cluster assembly factor [Thermoplasmatota archaeon]